MVLNQLKLHFILTAFQLPYISHLIATNSNFWEMGWNESQLDLHIFAGRSN